MAGINRQGSWLTDRGSIVLVECENELESVGDEAPEERIVERLITKALYSTFNRRVTLDDLDAIVEAFEDGFIIETGERTPSREYVAWLREVPGMDDAVARLGSFDVTDGAEEPAVVARVGVVTQVPYQAMRSGSVTTTNTSR